MTRSILVLLLLSTVAAPVAAQTSDLLALVPDVKWLEPAPTCREDAVAMEEVTLHLVIFRPSAGFVSAWKSGGFQVDGGTLLSTMLAAGSDVTPDGEFQVTIGNGPNILRPNDSGVAHLATIRVLVPFDDAEVVVRLLPAGDGAGYRYDGLTRADRDIPLALHSEDEGLLAYRLAPDCEVEVGNEAVAWGELKALYR